MNYNHFSYLLLIVLLLILVPINTSLAQTPGVWETFEPTLSKLSVTQLLAKTNTTPQLLFAETDGGFYRTSNLISWEQPNELVRNQAVEHLVLADSLLFAASNRKIYKITDNGESWSEIFDFGADSDLRIIFLRYINDYLYLSNFEQFHGHPYYRLRYYKDDEGRWLNAGELDMREDYNTTSLEEINGTLCVVAWDTIFYSIDLGSAWQISNTPSGASDIIPANGKLYANGTLNRNANNLLVSTNGIDWNQDTTEIGNNSLKFRT